MTKPTVWIPDHEISNLSSEGFQTLLSHTLSSLSKDVESNQEFINRIQILISSPAFLPVNRFYALYLLFKVTEQADHTFFYKLAQTYTLIDFLHVTAQYRLIGKISNNKRGRFFFSASPSKEEARMGVNFVRLCLESLKYWQMKYQSASSVKPWKAFFTTDELLKEKIRICTYYYFIDRNYDLSQDLSTWNFYVDLPNMIVDEPEKFEAKTELFSPKKEANEEEPMEILFGSECDIILSSTSQNYDPTKPVEITKFPSPKILKRTVKPRSGTLVQMWSEEERAHFRCKTETNDADTRKTNNSSDELFNTRSSFILTETIENTNQSNKESKQDPKETKLDRIGVQETRVEIKNLVKNQQYSSWQQQTSEQSKVPIMKSLSMPLKKVSSRFSSLKSSPQCKPHSKNVMSDLIQIGKSIERSKNTLSSYSSVSQAKQTLTEQSQRQDDDFQKKEKTLKRFSSIWMEKSEMSSPSIIGDLEKLNFSSSKFTFQESEPLSKTITDTLRM